MWPTCRMRHGARRLDQAAGGGEIGRDGLLPPECRCRPRPTCGQSPHARWWGRRRLPRSTLPAKLAGIPSARRRRGPPARRRGEGWYHHAQSCPRFGFVTARQWFLSFRTSGADTAKRICGMSLRAWPRMNTDERKQNKNLKNLVAYPCSFRVHPVAKLICPTTIGHGAMHALHWRLRSFWLRSSIRVRRPPLPARWSRFRASPRMVERPPRDVEEQMLAAPRGFYQRQPAAIHQGGGAAQHGVGALHGFHRHAGALANRHASGQRPDPIARRLRAGRIPRRPSRPIRLAPRHGARRSPAGVSIMPWNRAGGCLRLRGF